MKITKAIKDAISKIKIHSAVPKEEEDMANIVNTNNTNQTTNQNYSLWVSSASNTSATTSINSSGYFTLASSAHTFQPMPSLTLKNQEELNSEVFNTPIEDLANMWLAKFGAGFVTPTDVAAEDFYRLAFVRLQQAGKIEQYAFGYDYKIRLIT